MSVSARASSPPELWGWAIDQPRPGAKEEGLVFFLAGWVLGRASPATVVEVASEDRALTRAKLDRPRPDVAVAYPHAGNAESCGYRAPIGVFDLPEHFRLTLTVELASGQRVELGSVDGRHGSLPVAYDRETTATSAHQAGGHHLRPMETESEALDVLSGLIRASQPQLVVETGTFTGKGTRRIAQELDRNGRGHLHTVERDPQLFAQLSRLKVANVSFHHAESGAWCRDVAPSGIDLAFVDSGDSVVRTRDIKGLWPKLNPNAFLLVHDTEFHDQLYDLARRLCGPGIKVPSANGLGIWQRSTEPAQTGQGTPHLEVAVCAIYRNEAEYLPEWIEFHRLMGVQRFYLYDNGSTDSHAEVLEPYVSEGLVDIRSWPERPGQVSAYAHCLQTHAADVRWVAFIDIDEFLFAPDGSALPERLREYEPWPGIGVNCLVFGPGGNRDKPRGLVIENYLWRRAPGINTRKSIVDPSRTVECRGAHSFGHVGNLPTLDEAERVIEGPHTSEFSVSRLRINHYYTRSELEFAMKLARERADTGRRRNPLPTVELERLSQMPDETLLPYVPRVRAALGAAARAE